MSKTLVKFFLFIFIFTGTVPAYKAEAYPTLKFYTGFHDLGEFHDGLAPVKNEHEKLGYIDINGNLFMEYQFDTERLLFAPGYNQQSQIYFTVYENIADPYLSLNDKTLSGKIINTYGPGSPYVPSEAFNFRRGYASVAKAGRRFFVDKNGKEVVNPFSDKYYYVWPFYQNIAVAQKTESGLLGYIDRRGNELTEFKYLCASHYKDGVAMAIAAVMRQKDASANSAETGYINEALQKEAILMFPGGADVIDVFLDTHGSVLSWRPHSEDWMTYKFKRGDVFELTEISEGLMLKSDAKPKDDLTWGSYSDFWYYYPDGTVALRPGWEIQKAYPFSEEKIAKVLYNDSGYVIPQTGFIDNTGAILDNADIDKRFPYFFQDIKTVILDYDYSITKTGRVSYLNEIPSVSRELYPRENMHKLRKSYLLTGLDNRVLMDCTDLITDEFAKIYSEYWELEYSTAKVIVSDKFFDRMGLYKPEGNNNIYYIYISNKAGVEERVGYIVVE